MCAKHVSNVTKENAGIFSYCCCFTKKNRFESTVHISSQQMTDPTSKDYAPVVCANCEAGVKKANHITCVI